LWFRGCLEGSREQEKPEAVRNGNAGEKTAIPGARPPGIEVTKKTSSETDCAPVEATEDNVVLQSRLLRQERGALHTLCF
jgi:hypothetical protein